MADRLRALLDRPLDPSAARAILVFASAILVGFALVVFVGSRESGQPHVDLGVSVPSASVGSTDPLERAPRPRISDRSQDPQDVPGSAAARRVGRALRTHRALQHLPYRQGALRVEIVGARGGRAVLRVSAPTIGDARRGWRGFLRRFRDSGSAYLPRFAAGAKGAAR